MIKHFLFLGLCCFAAVARADNVVLLIGDGMGINHLTCAAETSDLFLSEMPVKGTITTTSANDTVTDSAAAATAYACGIKTNNGFLGVTPDKQPCETIAERAVQKGYYVGIGTTDVKTGATNSAFYTHVDNRHDTPKIESFLADAVTKMDIQTDLPDLQSTAEDALKRAQSSGKPFLLILEEARIDKRSHDNKLSEMQGAVLSFDRAVRNIVLAAQKNPNTTVIVLSDHETGGLNETCMFSTAHHTGTPVPLFATGSRAVLFQSDVSLDNTEIHHKIQQILFEK